MPLWLSDQAQDFLSKTLLKDPAKRSTAAQLLKHPWLKSLGFKQPADAVPNSIEVLEPVLPPRPVVQPLPQPVVITEPAAAEEAAVEAAAEEAVAVPQEVAVTATGVLMFTLLSSLKCKEGLEALGFGIISRYFTIIAPLTHCVEMHYMQCHCSIRQ